MKYYKIIQDGEVIGAISSDNFISFQPVTQCFLRSDERQGEYVSYNGLLYRDRWMKPIVWQTQFIQVQITEIDEATYQIFMDAIEHNEEIPAQEEPPVIPDPEEMIGPTDLATLEFIRTSKIKEMSYTCKNMIENGFDIVLSDGENHHFSLSEQDQLNLLILSTKIASGENVSYHADGELSKFYSAAEMQMIIDGAEAHKNYHTTYYNALKAYINSLDNIEDIAAVTYGTAVPEEFQSEVWKTMIE